MFIFLMYIHLLYTFAGIKKSIDMKFKALTAIAVSTLIMASCGEAPKEQEAEKETTPEAVVETATYMADADNSTVNWKGEVVGVYGHEGIIALKSGSVMVEGDQITGGEFVIDMTTIWPTDSASYKDEDGRRATDLVNHLTTDDFFAIGEYPTSTFEITSVDGNKVTGNLTVRGITNEETMTLESMEVMGDEVMMEGTMVFDRQKYDVAWVHYMKDMVLSDDITITYSLVAKKS